MFKKNLILLGAFILIIVFIGFFYLYGSEPTTEGQIVTTEEIPSASQPPVLETPTPPITETPEPELKEFSITAKQFEFIPGTITVNQGDRVRLIVTSIDVTHGFLIREFNVNERLEPGKTITVEFIADKKGEFSMVCNIVCGSGHSSMRGKLVVI